MTCGTVCSVGAAARPADRDLRIVELGVDKDTMGIRIPNAESAMDDHENGQGLVIVAVVKMVRQDGVASASTGAFSMKPSIDWTRGSVPAASIATVFTEKTGDSVPAFSITAVFFEDGLVGGRKGIPGQPVAGLSCLPVSGATVTILGRMSDSVASGTGAATGTSPGVLGIHKLTTPIGDGDAAFIATAVGSEETGDAGRNDASRGLEPVELVLGAWPVPMLRSGAAFAVGGEALPSTGRSGPWSAGSVVPVVLK
jgi:hypothetical protein